MVQQIVVVTVLPPGAVADGTTAAGLVATLNGPVRDFWQAQTGGAVDFTATAGAPRARLAGDDRAVLAGGLGR